MATRLFTTLLVLTFLSFPGLSSAKDSYPRNQGVDVLHYCFYVNLNDTTDRITGRALITVRLTEGTGSLDLDLIGKQDKVTGMVVDRVESAYGMLDFRHENNRIRIRIPDTTANRSEYQVNVHYSGIPADGLIISKNRYGDRTFFADNWPDRARNWIPCVDHPSDKATVEFIVSAPERYEVVSNGLQVAGYMEPITGPNRNRISHWKENVPVPTKVMVIGVADFAWETSGYIEDLPVQSWVFEEDRLPGFKDYLPAAGIATYFQNLIGPYSYEKLANVQSKTKFGGMENSGCIFYYERSVTGKNKLQSLLAHEIAHQWFGDAVTENDWHHVWLSEGFATYLEACYADTLIPGRQMSASMAEMRKSVISYYEKTHKPVIDTTITNFMDLLSTNSYQKGAWVLHMLRSELGDEIFWKGIRKFYETYRDKNAMTSDFQSIMESVSGRQLGVFFKQWLEVAGQPVLNWTWKYNQKQSRVEITILQSQSGQDFVFTLPVELLEYASAGKGKEVTGKTLIHRIEVNKRKTMVNIPVDFAVSEIIADPKCQLLFQEKTVN